MKGIIILSLIIAFFSTGACFGQNLVPNPSFEDTISCPTMLGQVTKARYWYDILNTPDYFHECSSVSALSVPSNTFGYQYPSTGFAYMGGCDYVFGTDTDYREIIGAHLIEPLILGETYYVTFKVSFSAGIYQAVNIATNRMGMLFSTTDFTTTPPPINNFSQIYSSGIIVDSINWTTIRGSFIADSNYSFISIGNFFKNYMTDTLNTNPFNHTYGYYYIDDVCVSTDSMYCEVWTGLPNYETSNEIIIYPNPADSYIVLENLGWTCAYADVVDFTGKLIASYKITEQSKSTTINIAGLPVGLFGIVVKNKNLLPLKTLTFFHH